MYGSVVSRCFPILLLLSTAVDGWGQATPAPKSSVSPTLTAAESPHPPSAKEVREAQIAADSEKLYQLAQQLKVEMDKSNKDTLSLSVIKKAAEIERLAHSISDRMKAN